jgi:hypothetical protein
MAAQFACVYPEKPSIHKMHIFLHVHISSYLTDTNYRGGSSELRESSKTIIRTERKLKTSYTWFRLYGNTTS